MRKPEALIIEDDAELANLYSHSLNYANYETSVIHNGQDAMDRLNHPATPSIIILDLHLPKRSGNQILDFISDNPRFNDTRIIIATADALTARTLEKRAEHILIKPISLIQLRELASSLHPSSR